MYEAPSIIELGTVADVTMGGVDGNLTDATFPSETPRDELTFS